MSALAASLTVASLPGTDGELASAVAPDSTITGRVFVDESLNGLYETGEAGAAGVTVSAYNAAGAPVGTAVSGQDGTYSLAISGADSDTVRVEFDTPVAYQSTFVLAASGGSRSSIRFVTTSATNVDYGVFDPTQACLPQLASVCFHSGPLSLNPTSRVLGLSPFETPASGNPLAAVGDPWTAAPTDPQTFFKIIPDDVTGLIDTAATKSQVGATWGVGASRTTGLLWNSAVIRRHVALGPQGIGGVYVVDRDGVLKASFNLETLGLNLRPTVTTSGLVASLGSATASAFGDVNGKVVFSELTRDITGVTWPSTSVGVTGVTYDGRDKDRLSRDIPAFGTVGKAGLGDLDVSKNGQYLWVTNLHTRTIHRFTIGGGQNPTLSSPASWSVDDGHTCAAGTGPLRPWGLEMQADGTVLVGAVCTNESATPSATSSPGVGVVLQLNPASTGAAAWDDLTTVDFSYEHIYDYCENSPQSDREPHLKCSWKSWSDDFRAIATVGALNLDLRNVANQIQTGQMWWTQPIIADITTLPDGSLALGINDRFSYQVGSDNYAPFDVRAPSFVTGYTAGGLRLLCKTANGWQQESGGDCTGLNSYVSGQRSDGKRTYSFFESRFGGHPATAMGGVAYANGKLVYSAMDAANYFSSGIRWVSTTGGNQVNGLTLTGGFGKGGGMGDVEVFCDQAPLQIGNRVWYDHNKNGIQDPDEGPVAGVTVKLYDGTTLVGTTVTNASGEYYFTSSNTEPAAGEDANPDAFGGGLAANIATFKVVMDVATDCDVGAPLDGWDLTIRNGTTSAGPVRDAFIDSNATEVAGSGCLYQKATVTVASMTAGQVNHTYDIGFFIPSVSVGDHVWFDLDNDGVQDVGEPGLAGVTVSVTMPDGSPVFDVSGVTVSATVTDADGNYLFTDLPAGQYKVTVTPPGGINATTPVLRTSQILNSDGASDLTLDFGFFAPSVSVGGLVWFDESRDGLQNAGESFREGVTVSVTMPDGSPAFDVFGVTVSSTATDANGSYVFDWLPPGQYQVTVMVPSGLAGTTPVQLTSVNLANHGQSDLTLDFGLASAVAPLPSGIGNLVIQPVPAPAPPPGTTLEVSVGDYVWWDTNADGRQDETDVPLQGVVLRITTAEGGPVTDTAGTAVTTTTTNASGWYTFDNLPPGQYTVRVQAPSGFVPTIAGVGVADGDSSTDTATSRSLTANGDRDHTLDFGFVAVGASLGNFVWFDANDNGIQDAGERPVVGAVLTVTDMDGNPVTDQAGRVVQPQTTGADGRYLFTNLAPGQYRVTITYPPGFGPARPIEGSSRSADSSTFVAVARVLADKEADLTLDFGVIPVVSVGDYVWWDTNRDGRQDSTDRPLEGVTLTITTADGQPVVDSQGVPVTTTLTDARGWYTFDNLPFGQYRVCVTDPRGYYATRANVGALDGDSSTGCEVSRDLQVGGDRDPTLDFGYVPLGTRLPATGTSSGSLPLVALVLLGLGLAAWFVAHRRHRLP